MPHDNQLERKSPLSPAAGADPEAPAGPEPGIALCLSGGGYRAMLFHAGAIWRLSELGFLPKLNRVSSVSGGSIIAALLGLRWSRLGFDAGGVARNLVAEVIDPIRALASRTIDEGAILGGLLMPGSISERIADAYRKHLFGNATLQDLPPDPPRFVINATNVQTGALFRFSRPFIADFRLGMIRNPTLDLALAVTASSAFPPVLSPVHLEFDAAAWVQSGGEDLHRAPYLTDVVLSDGGVYDNLGLETAWKRYDTILVSNGGGKMAPQEEPKGDWARHSIRINEIIDNQVRSLRARQVIGSFEAGERHGTYWGIRTDIADYQLATAMACPLARTTELAETKTRLQRLDANRQERLINWGYAVCDAGMRRHVVTTAPAPAGFPYPATGV
ncbi:MAG TPA: patatin-like phospholipase family protein [Vicinamibacterales bacterium]|nr:patatin-like phospholipase family protein [Vicinamibacterales bacterium]